jgi:hypothetical protein
VSRVPKHLQLSRQLSPEEVSQAWEYLVSLPEPDLSPLDQQPECQPPEHLQNLSDSDWYLLSSLLARETMLLSHSRVH